MAGYAAPRGGNGLERFRKITASVLNLLLPIVFAFSVGAVFIALTGKNPLHIYGFLIEQSLLSRTGILNTLAYATPLIMTGLGIAVSFKAGLYNMGIEGQMYMGAFFATFLGFTLKGLPPIIHVTICILGGMAMGMLYSIIPAVLKAYCHVNEMVATMMLNYAAIIFTKFLTNGPFTAKIGYPATEAVEESARLPRFSSRAPLTPAIFIALALVLLVWVIYRKTVFGFEIEAIGKHVEFADSVGMRVEKKIIRIFLLAGAISGIAGATEMLGVHYRFTPGFSTNPGLGWDGMLVALLGSHEPFSVLAAAIFFGALKYGGTTMQTFVGVSNDTIGIIQASLVLFLSARYISKDSRIFDGLEGFISKRRLEREEGKK